MPVSDKDFEEMFGIAAPTRRAVRGKASIEGAEKGYRGMARTAEELKALAPETEFGLQAEEIAKQQLALTKRQAGVTERVGPLKMERPPEVGEPSFLEKLGETISAPSRMLPSGLEALSQGKSFSEGALTGLRSAREGTTLSEHFANNPKYIGPGETRGKQQRRAALGLLGDIVLDPLNLVPFGKIGAGLGWLGKKGGEAIGGLGKALGYTPSPPSGLTGGLVRGGRQIAEALVPGVRLKHLGREAAEATGRASERFSKEAGVPIKQETTRYRSAINRRTEESITGTVSTFEGVPDAEIDLIAKNLEPVTGVLPGSVLSRLSTKGQVAAAYAGKLARDLDTPLTPSASKEFTDQLKAAVGGAGRGGSIKRLVASEHIAQTAADLAKKEEIHRLLHGDPQRGLTGILNAKDPLTGAKLVAPTQRLLPTGATASIPLPAGYSYPQSRWWPRTQGAVPNELARELDDLVHFGETHKIEEWIRTTPGVKSIDKLFSYYWKGLVTSPNPYFHVRNAMTNLYLMYQRWGPRVLVDFVRRGKAARDINKDVSPTREIVLGGKRFTYGELKELQMDAGVHRSGAFVEDFPQEIRRRIMLEEHPLLSKAGLKAPLQHGRFAVEKLIEEGRKVGNAIEDHAKTVAFMTALDVTKGNIQEALDLVRRTLYDYSDITGFERTVARRLIPFWVFMRKNAEYQMGRLLQAPQRSAIPFKFQEAAPRMFLSKEQEKKYRQEVPTKHLVQRLGVPIPSGSSVWKAITGQSKGEGLSGVEQAGGFASTPQPYAPFDELRLGGIPGGPRPMEAAFREFSQRTNPVIGLGIDWGTGKEAFRGVPLQQSDTFPTMIKATPMSRAIHNLSPTAGKLLAGTWSPKRYHGEPDVEGETEPVVLQSAMRQRFLNALPVPWSTTFGQFVAPTPDQTRGQALARLLGFGITPTNPTAAAAGELARLEEELAAARHLRNLSLGGVTPRGGR